MLRLSTSFKTPMSTCIPNMRGSQRSQRSDLQACRKRGTTVQQWYCVKAVSSPPKTKPRSSSLHHCQGQGWWRKNVLHCKTQKWSAITWFSHGFFILGFTMQKCFEHLEVLSPPKADLPSAAPGKLHRQLQNEPTHRWRPEGPWRPVSYLLRPWCWKIECANVATRSPHRFDGYSLVFQYQIQVANICKVASIIWKLSTFNNPHIMYVSYPWPNRQNSQFDGMNFNIQSHVSIHKASSPQRVVVVVNGFPRLLMIVKDFHRTSMSVYVGHHVLLFSCFVV